MILSDLTRLHPGLKIDLCIIATSGDCVQDRPLHELGGKGLFTKELELALLAGDIDFAVHSFKDVPVTMPLVEEARTELVVAAVPAREEPWDVLASARYASVDELPAGARVGTGSLRRRCQLLARRADLKVEAIRGNIDTRLERVRSGEFDAVILALAGVRRAKLFDESIMRVIPSDVMLPAAGQGALALQCRRDDARTREVLSVLNDRGAFDCVAAERALVQALDGDCTSPIAALATLVGSADATMLTFRGAVGAPGGELPVRRATLTVKRDDPQRAGRELADALASG